MYTSAPADGCLSLASSEMKWWDQPKVGTELLQELTGRSGNWIWAFWQHLALEPGCPQI